MDILGTIESSITLAGRLRDLVNSYADSAETTSKLRLFNGQLNVMRLELLHAAFAKHQDLFERKPGACGTLTEAAKGLSDELQEATTYLKELEGTINVFGRMKWAIWAETPTTKRFENINRYVDTLQGIIQLAQLAPALEPFNSDHGGALNRENTNTAKYVLSTTRVLGYSIKARWRPASRAREDHRPLVRVFVESYRTSGGEPVAQSFSCTIAERLWWSCENRDGPYQQPPGSNNQTNVPSYQTGVLPCIGFEEHRAVFLLPTNSTPEDQCTLRGLINKTEAVSLEVRFSLALQLADAVLKVHSAGLVHCAIRSDTVLFLAPGEKGEDFEPRNMAGVTRGGDDGPTGGVEEEARPKLLKRSGTFNKSMRRVGTALERLGLKDIATSAENGNRKEKQPKRQNSKRSLRGGVPSRETKGRGIFSRRHSSASSESLNNPTREDHQNNHQPTTYDLKSPVAGDVPPGFGSLYLISWAAMCYRGDNLPRQRKNWTRDIYLHPEQQDGRVEQAGLGHDTYSMAVCLLEIGLWKSLVCKKEDANRWVPGPLAIQMGIDSDLRGETYDASNIRERLVGIAKKELPGAMGESYTRLVVACLKCLDGDQDIRETWGTTFRADASDRASDSKAFRRVVLSFLLDINKGFAR
jgi:hypothetical protein